MAKTVTVHEAKTTLSELLRRVEAGEEIIIARGSKPVAILKNYDYEALAAKRRAGEGSLQGIVGPQPDSAFFDPLDEDLLEAFYNSKIP
jgi:prevent-host-death family protein